MNSCKEISLGLKEQNILMLDKSSDLNNIQESGPQKCNFKDEVGALVLNKGHQVIQEKMLFSVEKCLDLRNPYFEFCLSPNKTINSEKGNYIKNKEEGKQLELLRITKYKSNFFEASLPEVIENKSADLCEESNKLIENKQPGTTQLMKSTAPKKRGHENTEDDSSILGECFPTRKKMILLKPENELCTGNQYLEFILKSENSHLSVSGNTEPYKSNFAFGRERNLDDMIHPKNNTDIFGNRLTSKDRNKLKVICPHCTKRVPAPGFVRHLSYCMRVRIRKSTRRY